MNILYICEWDPDRTDFGSAQRTNLLYRSLKRVGRVHVICGDSSMKEVPGEKAHNRHWSPGAFARLVDHFCWKFYARFLPSCPKLLPFAWGLNVRESFPGVSFDLVVVRYLNEVALVRPWRYGPLWIDVDDHPLQLYDTLDAPSLGSSVRALGRWFVTHVVNFLTHRAQGCWVANDGQTTWFAETDKIHALANVPMPASDSYDPNGMREPVLLTVGYLAYQPNWQGVERFLVEIWPAVRARHPELSYWVAGGGLPEDVAVRWSKVPGVRCLGFVDDLGPLYAKALATVVPVDVGGGTCIKTLESLAHSRISLSTPFGARGLAEEVLRDGGNGVVVYRTPESFLSVLERMVLDENKRGELELRAKAYVDMTFSPETFARQCLESLASGRRKI